MWPRQTRITQPKFSRIIAWLIALLALSALPAHATPLRNRLVVSPQGPYPTITAALQAARDGDEIEVRAGTYRERVVVAQSVALIGVDTPVVDGGGEGTVVALNATGASIRGFIVQGSGSEPDQDHAGITLAAPQTVAENNRLRDVLFGIFVAKAERAIVRGNTITSKAEYESGRKGDSIRLWYSPNVIVERNHAYDARDVVIWYSQGVVVRDNVLERGRYAIHLMYCNHARIENNRIADNSTGVFTMYSKDVVIRNNVIRGQRGPSGYGLGFKDADNVETTNNVIVDNRGGIFIDGTPYAPNSFSRFMRNIIAFNDIGVTVLPAVHDNVFSDNTFWENVEQMAIQGGNSHSRNEWRGNYWSDYAGFDANGDGQGDVPYRAERFFESLTGREQLLRALIYSPAAQAIEMAAELFPIARPQPKLTDPTPRQHPAAIPTSALLPTTSALPFLLTAFALLGLGVVCGGLAMIGELKFKFNTKPPRIHEDTKKNNFAPFTSFSAFVVNVTKVEAQTALRVQNVSKHFGKVSALDNISFDVKAGEAWALWGMNGAGKTTLIKAMLGLLDFTGAIVVEGCDVKRLGKAARRRIGYVPQETVFYDWRVQTTMEFYARLKKVEPSRIPILLERLGLNAHAQKSVSALSGGLKQRLALAIALLADPPLLLLDEPTANLDSEARADYLALLASLRREGKLIIFASHRLEEVEALADHVLVLAHGRLVDTLTPETLRANWLPAIDLTIWVKEAQRAQALQCLLDEGLEAHLNGRGTVVVRVKSEQKMRPIYALNEQGIKILNFELERGMKVS